MHFDRTDRCRGSKGLVKILHYYYVYSESVSRVWQVNRLTNYQAQSQQTGNVTQMR